MNCIVFDLEWNELMPHQLAQQNRIGFPLSGEIMEIGAVRVTGDGHIGDTYECRVRPTFLTQMHPHVERLTGIHWDMLQDAPTFPTALKQFFDWCGADAVLLSWGTSDRQVLAENMRLHGIPRRHLPPWYDAQRIFGRFCLDRYEQYGLARACEHMGVDLPEDAHRAIYDAIAAAEVCSRLPLARGIRDYRYHGGLGPLEFRPTLSYYYFDGYRDKTEMWDDPKISRVRLGDGVGTLALTEKESCRKNAKIAFGLDRRGRRYLVRWKAYQYRQRGGVTYGIGREVYRAVPELIRYYRDICSRNRYRQRLHLARKNPAFRSK